MTNIAASDMLTCSIFQYLSDRRGFANNTVPSNQTESGYKVDSVEMPDILGVRMLVDRVLGFGFARFG